MQFRSTRRLAALAGALVTVALIPTITAAQGAGPGPAELAPTERTASDTTAEGTSAVTQAGIARGDSASRPLAIASAPGILTRRDLAIAAGFTAVAVVLFPVDKEFTDWVRSDRHLENHTLRNAMAGAEWGVEKGAVIAGGGMWALGLVARNRTVAGVGAHTLLSVGVTHQVTSFLKGAFGRSRPYLSSDSLPHDWQPGAGFGDSDRRSFPSGHTSTAFAFATAMSTEISRAWPRAGKIATPLLYAGATSAALARIYHDQHWASDVAVGAAVGILTTRATLRLLHGHPGNIIDKVVLNTRIVPAKGGVTLAITLPTP